MNRRSFLKTGSVAAAAVLMPSLSRAAAIDFTRIGFDKARFERNKAQTIMVFLYGGPSPLAGNLTNIETIKQASQSDYDGYFRGITLTENALWQEAGGLAMESLIADGDLSVMRTCFSQLREEEGNRSHSQCTSQNQRGVNNLDDTSGIFSIIGKTLYDNGVIDEETRLPFISMEGDSTFFSAADFAQESFLKPTAFSSSLDNPYERSGANQWFYYTSEERQVKEYQSERAAYELAMESLAQSRNPSGKIKEAFDKRAVLDEFINGINEAPLPDGVEYPNNSFAEKLANAVKILGSNPDTRIISLGSGGLGGWDDHSEARDYQTRMENLFTALSAAMGHIKTLGKENEINIMVFGEFGRNVNLNSSFGWDHGNLQNLYLLGGKGYFNSVGVVGETTVSQTGAINRMYLQPAEGAYWFEPYSIAATLYHIYGITNPEYLTGGLGPIEANLLI